MVYTIALVVVTLLLPVFGYTGLVYTVIMGGLRSGWIILGIHGLRSSDANRWAHRMFGYSMFMILAVCALFATGPILRSDVPVRHNLSS